MKKIKLRLAIIALCGFTSLFYPHAFVVITMLMLMASPNLIIRQLKYPQGRFVGLGLVFVAIMIIQLLAINLPEYETTKLRTMDLFKWTLLFIGFVPLSNLLKGRPKEMGVLIISSAVGLLSGLLAKGDIYQIMTLKHSTQTGFHAPAAISGLAAGIHLLCLSIFSNRIYTHLKPGISKAALVLAVIISIYLLSYILASSESRSSYISFVAIIIIYFINGIIRRNKNKSARDQKSTFIISAISITIVIFGLYINKETIMMRVNPDINTINAMIFSKDTKLTEVNKGESSIAYRIEAQSVGLHAWYDRIWFGWGPISSKAIIMANGADSLRMDKSTGAWLSHFHSGYIEFLVRFGVAGPIIIIIFLTLTAIRAKNNNNADNNTVIDFKRFSGWSLGMVAIWGINGVFTTDHALAIINILSATSYSLLFTDLKPQQHQI